LQYPICKHGYTAKRQTVNSMDERIQSSLLQRAAAGDSDAEEIIVLHYSRIVRACSRPYFLAGGDSEDLMQEGMLGLLSAIRSYDPQKKVQFSTYAEFCIRRRLYSAIRSATSNKHSPLNNYISLESPLFDENETNGSYFLRDPEDFVIASERFAEVSERFYGALSRFETRVLRLYLEGMSYDEMAAHLDKPNKSVDNAVQRIRRKLAQMLKNGDIQ